MAIKYPAEKNVGVSSVMGGRLQTIRGPEETAVGSTSSLTHENMFFFEMETRNNFNRNSSKKRTEEKRTEFHS